VFVKSILPERIVPVWRTVAETLPLDVNVMFWQALS
jgi:hypothetical protein